MPLLLIIISAFIIFWAIYVKARGRHVYESTVLSLSGVSILWNLIYVYLSGRGIHLEGFAREVQMLTEMAIIPLAYMYFASKTGRQWKSPAVIILWILSFEGLLPSWIMVFDHDYSDLSGIIMEPHRIYFVNGCKTIFSIYSADMVTLIQGIVTAFTIVPTVQLVRRYGLDFKKGLWAFVIWWISAIIFAVINASLTSQQLASVGGQWFFLCGMSVLVDSVCIMLALNLDSDPVLLNITPEEEETYLDEEAETVETVQKDKEEVSVNVGRFVEQCHEMAEQVRNLINVDKVYLDPEYSSEKAIMEIGTNRTYFSRMMQAEFGCKFTDMLNDARIEYARKLLTDTDLPLSEVAEKSGFSGAPNLSRKFSAQYGIAPSEYRKAHRPSTN